MDKTQQDTVLIFDYDGTLNNSGLIYVPAFRNMYERMVRDGMAESRNWEAGEITRFLGYSAVEMWLEFMPDISRDVMTHYSQGLGEEMLSMIESGQAQWYDGAEQTLSSLRQQGYRMAVLSNCRRRYLEANRKAFAMDRFFDGYYDCESYNFAPKTEIFREIQKELPAKTYWVIGDRRHDMEVATTHHLPSVGCLYGYGKPEELDIADWKIQDIRELPAVLSKRK
ncbi:MAG: HAD family hydrolase [Oscillospiraceae bacterium]|nr:HAD family hydrolase [Oscillospiraceae bacterium]